MLKLTTQDRREILHLIDKLLECDVDGMLDDEEFPLNSLIKWIRVLGNPLLAEELSEGFELPMYYDYADNNDEDIV